MKTLKKLRENDFKNRKKATNSQSLVPFGSKQQKISPDNNGLDFNFTVLSEDEIDSDSDKVTDNPIQLNQSTSMLGKRSNPGLFYPTEKRPRLV